MGEVKERVSIIIPCYNEQDSLDTLFLKLDDVERIIKAKYNLEIIFINDGSTDDTYERLSKRYSKNPDINIITYKDNKGYGYALKRGLKKASGDLIITIDSDTNYDQREIPAILSMMENGFDIITASPFSRDGKWLYLGFRFILSKLLSKTYSLILAGRGNSISTYTSCFRVYRRNILSGILPLSDDFLANAEILIRAILKGYKIREYPTRVYKREFGKSKMKIIKTIIAHIRFISKIGSGRI